MRTATRARSLQVSLGLLHDLPMHGAHPLSFEHRLGGSALTGPRSCLQILFSILYERATAAGTAKVIHGFFVSECERVRAFLDRHPADGIEMFLLRHVIPPTVTLGTSTARGYWISLNSCSLVNIAHRSKCGSAE